MKTWNNAELVALEISETSKPEAKFDCPFNEGWKCTSNGAASSGKPTGLCKNNCPNALIGGGSNIGDSDNDRLS